MISHSSTMRGSFIAKKFFLENKDVYLISMAAKLLKSVR